jgi:hypothetical protein
MTFSLALVLWMGLFLAAEESPGRLLSPGTRLVYSSGGRELPSWVIEEVVRDTSLGEMQNCSVIRLRTSPTQPSPEVRAQCVRDNVLYAWDASSQRHRAVRPLAMGVSMATRSNPGGTTSTFEVTAHATESIDSQELSVVATMVTTRDSTGRVVRRLRERFSLALSTATGGVFEVPDSTSSGGWRVERAFELTRVTRVTR